MATYYWVGGAGTWNNTATTNWSLSSGGAGGAGVPTTGDAVNFDANSGTGSVRVESTSSSGTATLNSANITLTLWGNISTQIFTLSAGTLSLSGYTLSCGSFLATGTTTRTINFSTGKISLNSPNTGTPWSAPTITGLSITGNPNVELIGGGAGTTKTINHGSTGGGSETNSINIVTATGFVGTLTFTAGSVIRDINIANIASTITLTNLTGQYGSLTIGGTTPTVTFPSSWTFQTTSGSTKTITTNGATVTTGGGGIIFAGGTYQLGSNFTGGSSLLVTLTAGTLNLNGYALSARGFVSTNTNARTLAFGTGSISLTATASGQTAWSVATATNLTVTGTPNVSVAGPSGGGVVTVSHGNTAGGSSANAINVTFQNVTSQTATITNGSHLNNLTFASGSYSAGGTTINLYGNLTSNGGSSTPSLSQLSVTTLGSGTQIITAPNLRNLTVNQTGITRLGAAISATSGALTLTAGTFDANNFNVAFGSVSSSNTNTRTLALGSGIWTITGSSVGWDCSTSTGLTVTGTADITVSAPSATFAGGGKAWPTLRNDCVTLTITGSNTFTKLSNYSLAGSAYGGNTTTFEAGSTQTVTTFDINGPDSTGLATINSTVAGTRATLSKSSGTVSVNYCNIQDSNATGGATWSAFFSTDAGNNLGWKFIRGAANFFAFF